MQMVPYAFGWKSVELDTQNIHCVNSIS